jgi:hypothetical protein
MKGIVGDTLKKPHRSAPPSKSTFMATGDSMDCTVLSRSESCQHMVGGIPRHGSTWGNQPRQTGVIPGYGGHISGKVAENIHGSTFSTENERSRRVIPVRDMKRTMSAPDHLTVHLQDKWDSPSLKVASRIPGYMGTIPGKVSETMHGSTFGQTNEASQRVRGYNPHVNCDGWMKGGDWPVDRRATYKFHGRTTQCDFMPHFTEEHEREAFKSNRRLGEVFGLKPPQPSKHGPGDRYLHSFAPPKQARADPSTYDAAGCSSFSTKLDPQRWQLHNAITLNCGNQRAAY